MTGHDNSIPGEGLSQDSPQENQENMDQHELPDDAEPNDADLRKQGPAAEEEADHEGAVGTTEKGVAASDSMVALGRAARSYLLYETDNEAIRKFLEILREKTFSFLERYGQMALDVRPWELVLDSEVVYLNRDRERSLSFRLFRDGVRRLVFLPDLEWDELTQFLGIISIRYTGIRQQEDDIVTLLWKAGFRHIRVESVEGFVPEDDEDEADILDAAMGGEAFPGHDEGGADGEGGISLESMFGTSDMVFDMPWPEYTERAPLVWQEVDGARLQELAEEDSSVALPAQCVRLVKEVLAIASDPVDPLQFSEAYPIIQEIRDFLLSEGLLSSLLELMQALQSAEVRPEDEEHREKLLAAITDTSSVARVIRTVPAGIKEVPPELLELVKLMPGDPLPLLMDLLRQERATSSRGVTRRLMVELCWHRASRIRSLIGSVEPRLQVDLLHVLATMDMEKAMEASLDLLGASDIEVQFAALGVLEQGPYSLKVGQSLAQLLSAPSREVRIRAARLLGVRKERWAFHAIVHRIEALGEADHEEAQVLGEALARIWPDRAMVQFTRWLYPQKILKRMLPGSKGLKWAAVSGLAMIHGNTAEDTIRDVAKSAGAALHKHCMQCLVRHRRLVTGDEYA